MIDKENNFDFLRLLFSSLVIVSHSFSLTNNDKDEIFLLLTNNQIALGAFSVKCFFIISGYLIFISLKRSKNLLEYIWKRTVRIFPALIVVLLLTLSFLPLIYAGSGNIFSQKDYWSYFYRNIGLYHMQYNVGGIFENNPYPKAINGSLWTIRYEFTMYLSLLVFFYINRKLSQFFLLSAFFGFFALANFAPNFGSSAASKLFLNANELYDLACYFIAGSFLASINFENFRQKKIAMIVAAIALLIATKLGQFQLFGYFMLPVIILGFGLSKTKYIKSIGKKIGDISYGVYIYGFIVQQTLLHFFDFGVYPLMFFSLTTTAVFAYFSWHLIEKKALKLKTTFKA